MRPFALAVIATLIGTAPAFAETAAPQAGALQTAPLQTGSSQPMETILVTAVRPKMDEIVVTAYRPRMDEIVVTAVRPQITDPQTADASH